MRAVSTLAPPVSIEHSLISPRDSITRVKSDAPLGHRCSRLVISSPVSVVQRSVMVWPSSARRILSGVTSLCARWAQPSDTVMFRPSALPRTSPAGGPEGIVVGTLSAGAEPPDESREWSSDPPHPAAAETRTAITPTATHPRLNVRPPSRRGPALAERTTEGRGPRRVRAAEPISDGMPMVRFLLVSTPPCPTGQSRPQPRHPSAEHQPNARDGCGASRV